MVVVRWAWATQATRRTTGNQARSGQDARQQQDSVPPSAASAFSVPVVVAQPNNASGSVGGIGHFRRASSTNASPRAQYGELDIDDGVLRVNVGGGGLGMQMGMGVGGGGSFAMGMGGLSIGISSAVMANGASSQSGGSQRRRAGSESSPSVTVGMPSGSSRSPNERDDGAHGQRVDPVAQAGRELCVHDLRMQQYLHRGVQPQGPPALALRAEAVQREQLHGGGLDEEEEEEEEEEEKPRKLAPRRMNTGGMSAAMAAQAEDGWVSVAL
ncbi:hypothetical protein BDZ97DRAFT_1913480 [Flammula alnicola]|nr:hypothetical protein BDZ97DRAFT_1913480 [Flammula alnicola]